MTTQHSCHKETTFKTDYQACAHTHCSFQCNFVLKNKEQSIILHLKNLQSFTVGKLIDMIEIILF